MDEAGQRQLGAAHAPTDGLGALVDDDRTPGPGQGDRGREAVWPGSNDDRVGRGISAGSSIDEGFPLRWNQAPGWVSR